MSKTVKSMKELEGAFKPVLKGMVDDLANKVYDTLNQFLEDYYVSWQPDEYKRTLAFLNSAVKTDVKMEGGKYVAYVYIDYKSLNYSGNVTGYQAVKWADTGFHGGLSVSHEPHVWQNTIKNTIDNGSLIAEAIRYLKSKGIDVKTV